MNAETFRIFELVKQPILVAFVDFEHPDKEIAMKSIDLVDNVLKEVAPAFFHGLIVSYADNNVYKKHRRLLGVTHQ